jgi:hypothetical protein
LLALGFQSWRGCSWLRRSRRHQRWLGRSAQKGMAAEPAESGAQPIGAQAGRGTCPRAASRIRRKTPRQIGYGAGISGKSSWLTDGVAARHGATSGAGHLNGCSRASHALNRALWATQP